MHLSLLNLIQICGYQKEVTLFCKIIFIYIRTDISRIKVEEKYFLNEKGEKVFSKDYAFSIKLIKENGVGTIPCSVFYSDELKSLGNNLVRFAFCKTDDLIADAKKKLS